MRLFVIIIATTLLLITIGCENSGVKVIKKDIDTAADEDLVVWTDEAVDEDTATGDTAADVDEMDDMDWVDIMADGDTVVTDDAVDDTDTAGDTATDDDAAATDDLLPDTASDGDDTAETDSADDDQTDGTDLSDSVDSATDEDGLLPDADSDTDTADRATIYKIKLGEITPGTATVIEGIVTGATDYSFFVQVPEAEHDAILGYTYSGIYVYTTNTSGLTLPAVGDFVSVAGTVQNYYDALQIATVTAITPLAPGLVPMPVEVLPADVATGGTDMAAYNGVLVTVGNVSVLSIGSYGEFTVTDSLIVDDTLYSYTLPTVGTDYESITGVMHYAFSNAKLEPRSLDDMVIAPTPDTDAIVDADTAVTDTATDVDDLLTDNTTPDADIDDAITIYDIKQNLVADGTVVTVSGVVTSATTYSFFLQVPEAEHNATLGYTYSGIYVYRQTGSTLTMPAQGDLVTVSGTIDLFYDNWQITTLTAVTPTGTGTMPTPVTVLPADVATGGADMAAYNGVLVEVDNVSVLDTATFGFGEFSVTDDLRIDDTLFAYTMPTVGTNYESLTGVMHYSFSNAKLEPRSLDDMVVAPTPDDDVIADIDTTPDADTAVADTATDADDLLTDGTVPDADVDADAGYPETLCATLTPPAEGLCTTAAGSGDLLLRGVILGHDQIYRGGEVLVGTAGDIICVGCDCSAEAEYAAATVVECTDGVISPALINAHDHLGYTFHSPSNWGTERYDHRHDWRTGARGHTEIPVSSGATAVQKQWGELRNVIAGTTVIAGSGGADGFLRNVDQNFFDPEGLNRADVFYNTFPLGDQSGTLLASGCAYPGIDTTSMLNNDCYFAHVAEGIDTEARNEFLCLSSTANGGGDLTESNSAFVHLAGLKAADAQILAQNGASHIWSPRSNISLYGNTAPVTLFKTLGVNIGIGTDWTPSGSINVLRELKCADHLNTTYYAGFFTARDLWRMATINNATAFRLAEVTGSLQTGKVADIAIFDGTGYGDDPYQAVVDANVDSVLLTLRGGLPLYGDTDIMAIVPGGQTGCEALGNICGVAKSACIERETGITWASLGTQNASSYGLFFCGTPTSEPTCDPLRTTSDDTRPYNGPTTDDLDGDGIINGIDDCPTLFNPIRPVDGGAQADADSDGIGDLCDPTPLGSVSTVDPDDKDGDGIPNASDNCPYDANTDQLDDDLDGTGNVCDICPATPNPMFGSCGIISIYDLKDGTILPGNPVETTGVVTAVQGTSFFLQVPEADHDPVLGYTFSGIYVYSTLTAPAVGDIVTVAATLTDYNGLLELSYVAAITPESSGNDLPMPVVVADPADLATGGQYVDDYNAVLVTVENVTVLATTLGFGEFSVTGALRIDDTLYTYAMPTVGDSYDSITGIMHYTYYDSKLEPRDAADMVKTPILCGSDVCEEWEECQTDACVVKTGRCGGDGDCTEPTPTCNVTTHYCEGSGLTVLNGDFELWSDGSTPDSWTADSGVGVAKETVTVHGGSAAAKLTRTEDNNTNTDFVSGYIAITPGTVYTLSAYFYDDTIDARGRILCQFFDSNKTLLSADTIYDADYTANSASWQEMTLTCSHASAVYMRVGSRVYKDSGTATGGFVYLDDVTITAP